ncbi:MAG TPA: hypothetical protein VD884_05480 [Ohtaekwangia sp.]|nr:hypothetical protein [Ohtaekwangia sp.]
MRLNLLPLAFFFLFVAFACKDDEKDTDKKNSQNELLTSNNSKTWKIIERSTDEEEDEPSCKISNARNADNRWTFYKNGDLRFDNGDITEDSECENDEERNCCSDLRDLFGTWAFSADKTTMILTAKSIINDDGEEETIGEEELMNATIDKLTEDELVLTQEGETIKFTPVAD